MEELRVKYDREQIVKKASCPAGVRGRRSGAATFYTTGMEHSSTGATGTGWESTPWHATQPAAWDALEEGEVRHDAECG
jgi:hypothetical protein